jgi:Zn-dependent protease
MLQLSLIQKISVWVIPILFAITVHEAAHAWMANRLGDTTAKMLGRLTLNPIKHIDLFGTILVPITIAILSNFSFVFGWAKPVPIDWGQLRNPKRDTALVAAAGPLSNLVMAIFWTAMMKLSTFLDPMNNNLGLFLLLAGQAGIIINLILAYLNIIPIPPLDGSRIVLNFLKPHHAMQYLRLEPYGFFILLLLILTGVLGLILSPLMAISISVLRTIFAL